MVAVNTEEQKLLLICRDIEVIVVGNEKPGPVYATHCLSQRINGNQKDIIILVSDDFYAPPKWDIWLESIFNEFDGGIMVNDGYQEGQCVTLPIMTFSTLLKLNRIIYHPSYIWQFADEELYHNLLALNRLKNMRGPSAPIFEHRHWVNNKRPLDEHDRIGIQAGHDDINNFHKRMSLSMRDRLTI
jgi:hypothetical protein